MDDIREAIDGLYGEYEASVLAGDLDRWLAQWTDDGVQLPAGSPMNVGLGEIRTFMRDLFDSTRMLEFNISRHSLEVFGDSALAYGTYTWLARETASGDEISWDGKFLTVFQEQADKSWKIYRDIFNSNVPLG